MNWFRAFRRKHCLQPTLPRKTALRVEAMEERVVPTITVTGTPGNDAVTSRFFYDNAAGQYRGEIALNGAVVSSFLSTLYTSPAPSIFLLEPLVVNGLGGNDNIDLSALRDPVSQSTPITVHGGAGNDTIVGSYGHDRLYGDAGADSLNGGVDEDQLFADDSDVALIGGGGVDVLNFESYSGFLRAANDSITMNGNTISANSGKFNGISVLNITGSNGDDTFDLDQFTGYQVNIAAKGGGDTIRVNTGGTIDGGGGNDRITSLSQFNAPQISGGGGDDRITLLGSASVDGGAGNDVIDARNAVQGFGYGVSIAGGAGNDTITGSAFNDALDGGIGNDALDGGTGNDNLIGGPGRDSITGGGGDDTFEVDASDDRWIGGTGIDSVLVVGNFNKATVTDTTVTIGGNAIAATGLESISITGTAKNDALDGTKFSGRVEFSGLEGNDVLRAGAGGSKLDGGAGNDLLVGGAGADVLLGGGGADQLHGNAGDDDLYADLTDTILAAGLGANDAIHMEGESTAIVITDTSASINGTTFPNHGAERFYLLGSNGNDSLNAATYSGAVSFDGNSGDDAIQTGGGNDTITGGAGADSIATGGGDDTVTGDADDVSFDTGTGKNELAVFGLTGTTTINDVQFNINGRVVPTGSVARLTLEGSAGDDTIDASGFSGYTVIYDFQGANLLKTGQGGSEVYANDGLNTIYGGNGADNLVNVRAAFIDAGGGDDLISASPTTVVIAGAGNDIVYLSSMTGIVTLTDSQLIVDGVARTFSGVERLNTSSGTGDDQIDASAFSGYLSLFDAGGSNVVRTGSGGSDIYFSFNSFVAGHNTVIGGSGNDTITETGAAGNFSGGDGNDTITGGFGDDLIDGGTGNDVLTGGAGTDTLLGRVGADTFHRDADPATFALEQFVWDFNAAEGDVLI